MFEQQQQLQQQAKAHANNVMFAGTNKEGKILETG
jgi:hypothetical protein